MGQLLVVLAHADRLDHVPREPGHGRRVPGGALVADIERAEQAGEDSPRQRDVLLGPFPGVVEQVGHVREREHGGERERDPTEPDLDVDSRAGDDQRHVDERARNVFDEGPRTPGNRIAVVRDDQRRDDRPGQRKHA
jgi:hypothetical protein